jgi:cytochrome c oxidase assembly protein Cox11
MHPLLKNFLRIFIVCAAIFFLIQPFNWYCQLTRSCQPFYVTYHFPKKEGTQNLKTTITAQSKFRDVDFYSDQYEVNTVTNRKNIVKLTLKNNSKKIHYVFPKMTISPPQAVDYIVKYECPCLQTYRLKPKETLIVNFEYEINEKIDSEIPEYRTDEDGIYIDFRI